MISLLEVNRHLPNSENCKLISRKLVEKMKMTVSNSIEFTPRRGFGTNQGVTVQRIVTAVDKRPQLSLWGARTILCLVLVCDLCVVLCASRTVRTLSGAVSGVVVTPQHPRLEAVEVFKGLPYAAPPKRFSPPEPAKPWRGVKSAGRFAPACPQRLPDFQDKVEALREMPKGLLEHLKRLTPMLSNQSENCLYLNIYTPLQASASTKFPVLVFVEGERFEWSPGHLYDGSVLASYGNLIVITLSYRLGLIGFLNTDPTRRSVANFGLLDIIAALRWIQSNIQEFGGNPDTVTLAGHGSGAACVHWLMSSPAVPHGTLFHRAILMSGSAASIKSSIQDPWPVTQKVARHVDCPLDHDLLSCLRQTPLETLMTIPLEPSQFSVRFGPSEDGVIIMRGQLRNLHEYKNPKREPNLVKYSRRLNRKSLRHKKTAKYDLLLGVVKVEAFNYFSELNIKLGIESEEKIKILQTYVNQTYRFHQAEILATLVNEYTDWERPVQHPVNTLHETMEALGDGLEVAPLVRVADLHSGGDTGCYMYVFGHQTRGGDYPQKQGCVYGEELPYVFGAPLSSGRGFIFPYNFSQTEVRLSEAVMDYWANFARIGDPNRSSLRPHEKRYSHRWLPYDEINKRYLSLDNRIKMRDHYRAHRLSFWLSLVPQLYRAAGRHKRVPDKL